MRSMSHCRRVRKTGSPVVVMGDMLTVLGDHRVDGVLRAGDPAGGGELRRLEPDGEAVFQLDPGGRTSNCNAPTTPTMKPEPKVGLNTLAAPSSANCIRALSRCLAFSGIARTARLQQFRRKRGDAGEAQSLALRQGVTDTQLAMVGDADDVARPRPLPPARGPRPETSPGWLIAIGLFRPHVRELHAAVEVARGEPHEGHAGRGVWGPCWPAP